jgi:hypothetical protein
MDYYDLCRFCLKFVETGERKYLNSTVKERFEFLTNVEVGSFHKNKDLSKKLDNFLFPAGRLSWIGFFLPILSGQLKHISPCQRGFPEKPGNFDPERKSRSIIE